MSNHEAPLPHSELRAAAASDARQVLVCPLDLAFLLADLDTLRDQKTKSASTAKAKTAIGFPAFLNGCKERNEKPIPDNAPVFAYAESVKLPLPFLRIQWMEFKERYADGQKRYKDWRTVFANSVRGNWFHLWSVDRLAGDYYLTTQGKQAQMRHGVTL